MWTHIWMQTIKFFHYEATGRLPFKRRWQDRKLPAITLSVCREVLSNANRDPVVDVAGVFRRTRFHRFSVVPAYFVRKQAKTSEQSGDDPTLAPISHTISPTREALPKSACGDPIDEQAALGDHAVAGREALGDLDHVAAGQPDLDPP